MWEKAEIKEIWVEGDRGCKLEDGNRNAEIKSAGGRIREWGMGKGRKEERKWKSRQFDNKDMQMDRHRRVRMVKG